MTPNPLLPEGEPGGWTVFRLPRSHWHCTLYEFDWAAVQPAGLEQHVTTFLVGVQDGKAPHLLLTGRPGIGKSHIGVGAYRVASAVWGTSACTWLNVPTFCEAVKQSYGSGDDLWSDYEGARRLVVLDDLFGRDLSTHEVSQIVYRLIDTAYQNGAALVATMNQSAVELKDRLAAHEVSRLLANSTILELSAAKDWRRK